APPPTLSAYTTLFRSVQAIGHRQALLGRRHAVLGIAAPSHQRADPVAFGQAGGGQRGRVSTGNDTGDLQARPVRGAGRRRVVARSEEHTSELQSRENL